MNAPVKFLPKREPTEIFSPDEGRITGDEIRPA